MDDYVTKPIDRDVFKAAIDRWVDTASHPDSQRGVSLICEPGSQSRLTSLAAPRQTHTLCAMVNGNTITTAL